MHQMNRFALRAQLSRRRLVAGLALACASVPVRASGETEADGFRVLRARPGTVALRGGMQPPTAIWGYDGTVPGPTLRVRQGEELRVRLVNELPEPTTVHWHGLRLPNAMDGVPHLTQHPIAPGARFDYRFRAPDAGTFWYHSHLYSSEQIERGLHGALIVEEPVAAPVDRDLVLVLDDWRLTADGRLDEASFRSFHDAAREGRLGPHLTVNGAPAPAPLPVRANERLRLRLVNAANARVLRLRFERHVAWVMAIDGQPAEPFAARDGRVALGPGNRIDVFVDAALEPGAAATVVAEDPRGNIDLLRLVYAQAAPFPARPPGPPAPLPPNPLPERLDLKGALRIDAPLDGGMMSGLMMERMRGREIPGHGIEPAARIWTLAGRASSGHDGPPLFTVARGRTVVLAFDNRSAFPHAMHVHGHHFRLLDRLDDGWAPFWLDTVTVAPRRTDRIAFRADNPGKWMIHCHMLEHHETGMAAWFAVT
jgi:FtsP/CotA-like multicopper oxidase with cupredoxin domain